MSSILELINKHQYQWEQEWGDAPIELGLPTYLFKHFAAQARECCFVDAAGREDPAEVKEITMITPAGYLKVREVKEEERKVTLTASQFDKAVQDALDHEGRRNHYYPVAEFLERVKEKSFAAVNEMPTTSNLGVGIRLPPNYRVLAGNDDDHWVVFAQNETDEPVYVTVMNWPIVMVEPL